MATPPKTTVRARKPVKKPSAQRMSELTKNPRGVNTDGPAIPKTTVRARKPVKKVIDASALAEQDLARSGLAGAASKKMKVRACNAAETAKLTNGKFHCASYVIPYGDVNGKDTSFLRLRFLEEVRLPGETKPIRYYQPPGTLPKPYFPRGGVIKWNKVVEDTSKPIYITEGEKKAECGAVHGLNVIGLGGVWSWRSSKFGKKLLDELEDIAWDGREVIVVYDSDLNDNPQVQAALTQLGRVLLEHGAVVSTVRLTSLDDGSKAGLDDYIMAKGVEAFTDLDVEPLSDSTELWKLNEEFALVRKSGGIIEIATNNMYSKSTFCEVICANRRFTRVNQEGKLKDISAPEEWIRWSHRREYADVTYAPGKPMVTDDKLNLWSGWGCEPKQGNVKPFLDVLRYVLRGNEEHIEWFMKWAAYPIKHPGTKLYASVLIWGSTHGTGKSLLFYMLGKVYGENFRAIGQEDLESQFNDWSARKQFVMGEEVTSSDKRKDTDRLKYMTTRKEATINVKYQPQYTIPDYVNFGFTSNHPDAFFVEPTDRRMAIFEAPLRPGPQSLYDAADAWLESEDGPAALMHYLLHNVDLRDFNPKGHAIETESKEQMIELSVSDLDTFARQLVRDPDSQLGVLGQRAKRGDLFTIEELLEVFDPGQGRRTTKIALSKALRRAGIAALPFTVTATGGKTLYPVRNVQDWYAADHGTRQLHYDNSLSAVHRNRAKLPVEAKKTEKVVPITKAKRRGK